MVMRLEQDYLLAILHHECRIEARRIYEDVQRLFGQSQPHRRNPQHLRGKFHSLREQFVGGNNIADQADCLGAVGLEEAACEQQLGGDGETNQPRQEITRAHVAAADADADIGGIHPCL